MKILTIAFFAAMLILKPSQNGNSQNPSNKIKGTSIQQVTIKNEVENDSLKRQITNNQDDIIDLINRLRKSQKKVVATPKKKLVFVYKKPRQRRMAIIPNAVDTITYQVGCPDLPNLVQPVIAPVKKTFFQRLFHRKKR